MCGIIGLISKKKNGFTYNELETFEQMLICDSVRGEDGTGVAGILSNRQAKTVKIGSHPYHLIHSPEYVSWKSQMFQTGKIVIGHNRKATHGTISSENSHPFSEGKIILVHNGTIPGLKEGTEKEVDSHALADKFNKNHFEDTLLSLGGAWALAWYDLDNHTLYLVRNDERPLYLIETESSWAFCSEVSMAYWLFVRNEIKLLSSKIINPFNLIKIQVDPFTMTTQKIEVKSSCHHTVPFMGADWEGGDSFEERLPERPTTVFQPSEEKQLLIQGNAHYKLGDKVIFKGLELHKDKANGKFKIRGRSLNEIGALMYMVIGWLPNEVKEEADAADYMVEESLEGILTATADNNRAMWVKNICIPDCVTTLNNVTLPKVQWNALCSSRTCDDCHSTIRVEEVEYCCLTYEENPSRVQIVCPVCLNDALSEDQRHAFKQMRDLSLQNGEQVSKATGEHTLH